MIKIVFVTDYLTLTSGGPRFFIDVFKQLARKGFEISVITGTTDNERIMYIGKEIDIVDLKVYKPHIFPSDQPINVIKFLSRASYIIKEIIKELPFFVLHLNSHFPNLIPYIIRSYTSIPIVCSIHHLEEIYQFYGLLPKLAKIVFQDMFEVNSPCTIIHVPSNSTKQKVEHLSIVNRGNVIVIPPGIEIEKYTYISKRTEKNLFIMIGRLERRKHYDHAVAAFKIVVRHKPEAKLFIIGDGPLKQYLTRLIRRLLLEKNVFLLGLVDEETKLDLLSRAQALIHLGYPEGFGTVLIEALASGTPVIAYNVPPLNEIIEHKVTGTLVNKDSIIDLARVIMKFDKYDFHYNKLREIAKKYDISIVAKKFELLYKHLVKLQK